jgi:transitional endoplasmic reticulum ATPase
MNRNPPLPDWAEELRERYLAGEASMFMLHGNARDLFPWEDSDGTRYVPLRGFLERFLARAKDIVAYYNCSEGLEFPDGAMRARFIQGVNARSPGSASASSLSRSPNDVLPMIEDLITDTGQNAAVVIDYAETVVPSGDLSFMSEADKANLVSFQRWSSDPALLNSNNLVLMVTENLSDINRRVVATAQIVPIQIPLPDTATRRTFIHRQDLTGVPMEISADNLAEHTAGLSLVQVRGLLRNARQSGEPITFRTVSLRKKSIIEQECHGLVEFVDPRHNFNHVGGMEGVKADLMRIAESIRKGHRNRVPMGLIFVGPMGTGKTYLAEAFAGESGLTCLKFKNFREKWVGSTESNLEKILQVVEALGYVLLIIDEADRSMSAGREGDGGTSSRVVARIKEFMSDTSHRGRVVIVMMTNRPDKLDTDLKRPGRFDVKVPFFFPEESGERQQILAAIARKNKLLLADDVDWEPAAAATEGYSAAELEAVLLAAGGFASENDREEMRQEDLMRAATDVIPSRDTRMLDFMELLAVFEASSKRMLPERFRDMDTHEVLKRLDQARALLGNRVL